MPVVFVHGVGNRWGADLDRGRKNIEVLFRTVSLPLVRSDPDAVAISQPYWGDLGGNPSAGATFATLPTSGTYETFGGPPIFPEMLTRDLVQVIATQPDQPLLATARQVSLACAVDLLWSCAVESVQDEQILREMAKFIAPVLDYAERNPSPRWLAEVNNDLLLLLRVKQEVELSGDGSETFGLGDWWGYLTSGASQVRDIAQRSLIGLPRRLGSQAGLYFLRPWMTSFAAQTIGDILVYTAHRGNSNTPGEIVKRILAMVQAAADKQDPDKDPLIAIGHSLGGVILYDLFSYFATNLQCGLLVTVGSQVGFLQELGLLASSSVVSPSPSTRIPRPANVLRWLNVFDEVDVLAFATQPVFTGVEDFSFSNQTGALSAHTSYFWSPRFHRRLGARMREARQ
jgi:hypothetical protein